MNTLGSILMAGRIFTFCQANHIALVVIPGRSKWHVAKLTQTVQWPKEIENDTESSELPNIGCYWINEVKQGNA